MTINSKKNITERSTSKDEVQFGEYVEVNASGKLHVPDEVFFVRPGTRELIETLTQSKVYKTLASEKGII